MVDTGRLQLRTYYWVNGVYSLGRALPQAVLTPILVGRGLSFSEIAVVQMVFAAAQILAEFPAGMMSDMFSRKLSYQLSIVLMLAAYGTVFVAQGLLWMIAAWALYGVAAAFLSASMDFHFVRELRADPFALRRFYATDRNVMLATSAVAALLSSWLFGVLGDSLYAWPRSRSNSNCSSRKPSSRPSDRSPVSCHPPCPWRSSGSPRSC